MHPAIGWEQRTGHQENISAPIHLESGTAYYVEALMKEASGGDNLAVTWRIPGGEEPTNGAPPIRGEFLAAPRHPSALAVTIVQPPSDATVVEFEASHLHRRQSPARR